MISAFQIRTVSLAHLKVNPSRGEDYESVRTDWHLRVSVCVCACVGGGRGETERASMFSLGDDLRFDRLAAPAPAAASAAAVWAVISWKGCKG